MAKARARKSPAKKAKRASDKSAALPAKAAKAALDRATQDIRRLQKDSSKNAWVIGRRLAQVAELELHKARGFSSIEDYAESELALSRDTAFLYMRVAQAFSETVAAAFGAEKLDRALRYIAATPEEEKPKDIPTLKIRVPPEDGGEAQQKPFEEVTIAELRRAVQAARGGKKKPGAKKKPTPKWLEEEAAAAIDNGHKALDKAVGRAAAATADVTVRRTGDDKVVVDIRGVPLERAGAAFKALAAAMK
jgi:hypothetical protein